ncbi:hypothetical protein ACFQ0M_43990 [Kitasatospora aburaviensis]
MAPRSEAATGSSWPFSQSITSNQDSGRSCALVRAWSTRALSVVPAQTRP